MKKRSVATQATIDSVNKILASDNVYITVIEDGKRVHVYESTTSKNAQLYKQGLCDALVMLLHRTDSYKGYMYLELDADPNVAVLPSEEFNRKYF